MKIILSDFVVGISEFTKNPVEILLEANNQPVAVLEHDKAVFYAIPPELFEAIMEEIADQDLHKRILTRLAEKSSAVEVDLDEL